MEISYVDYEQDIQTIGAVDRRFNYLVDFYTQMHLLEILAVVAVPATVCG